MFESITLITVSLCLWFAWQLKSLGLTSTIPKDEGNRAHFFAAQCLEVVKKELSGADIVELDAHSVQYHPHESAEANSRLWSEGGQARLTKDGKSITLHDKTGNIDLSFEALSARGLMVRIAARVGDTAKHEVGVRLEAHLPAAG